MEPEQLRSNQFWGKRAGSISPSRGRHFQIKRGSGTGGTSNNVTRSKSEYSRVLCLLAQNAKIRPRPR